MDKSGSVTPGAQGARRVFLLIYLSLPPLWGRVGWGVKPWPKGRTPHPNPPPQGGRGFYCDQIKNPAGVRTWLERRTPHPTLPHKGGGNYIVIYSRVGGGPVRRWLERRTPPPNPPPQGGREFYCDLFRK
jgi:hypothetical protein